MVINIIRHGLKLSLLAPLRHPIRLSGRPPADLAEESFIDSEIQSLLRAGAIRVSRQPPLVQCAIFTVPKKRAPGDDRPPFRLVHNLKPLNARLHPVPTHRLPSVLDLAPILKAGHQTFVIDVHAAYHHVQIHPDSQTLLGFAWQKTFYVWTVCPFGLAHSAHAWNLIGAAATRAIQASGVTAITYVDDIIGIGGPQQLRSLTDTLASLGIQVAPEKIQPPSHESTWLGFRILSSPDQPPRLGITKARAATCKSAALQIIKTFRQFPDSAATSKRTLARVVGKLAALAPMARSVHLLLLPLKLAIKYASSLEWDDLIPISEDMASAASQWLDTFKDISTTALAPSRPLAVVTTDAATSVGWGARIQIPDSGFEQVISGLWSTSDQRLHITALETLAVLRAFQTWSHLLNDRAVILKSDATAVVHSLRRHTTRSPTMASILLALHSTILDPFNIHVIPEYIPGVDNVVADAASRLATPIVDPHDYIIKMPFLADIINSIQHLIPQGSWVDRFATDTNHRFPVYNARRSIYPGVTNVFETNPSEWAGVLNYAFPPCTQPIITRLVSLLASLSHLSVPVIVLLILPQWLRAPWWTILTSLPGMSFIRHLPQNAFLSGLSGAPGPTTSRWTMSAWIWLFNPTISPRPGDPLP